MKYLISSVTIGACLLLSSAGDVFAQVGNPHPPGTTGQLGTTGPGGSTASGTANCATQPSPPGQATNTKTNSSAFPALNGAVGSSAGTYAGAGSGNYGAGTGTTPNPAANSQYDVACLRASQVP
jgi:hypothetical protein